MPLEAVARQAAVELVRGVSTGAVVWASLTPCAPALSCPASTCICHAAAPAVAEAVSGFSFGYLLAAFAAGLLAGLFLRARNAGAQFNTEDLGLPTGARGRVLRLA